MQLVVTLKITVYPGHLLLYLTTVSFNNNKSANNSSGLPIYRLPAKYVWGLRQVVNVVKSDTSQNDSDIWQLLFSQMPQLTASIGSQKAFIIVRFQVIFARFFIALNLVGLWEGKHQK